MLLRRSPQNLCYVGILAGEDGLRPTGPSALGFHVTNRYSHPCQVGMYVISPTIFPPGSAAVKSRFTRSGIGPAAPCSVSERRHGRGWQGTRPSSRISRRTSSGLHSSPPRASAAWTRRYPYSPLFASNRALILIFGSSLLCAVADCGRDFQS